MKSIAITAALALASTLSLAQATKDQVPNRSEAPHNQTMPGTAGDYWKQHAKDGYMTKDKAMGYKSKDAKSMDYMKMDMDNDGRVSQSEWSSYHSQQGMDGGASKNDPVANRSEAPKNQTTPN